MQSRKLMHDSDRASIAVVYAPVLVAGLLTAAGKVRFLESSIYVCMHKLNKPKNDSQ